MVCKLCSDPRCKKVETSPGWWTPHCQAIWEENRKSEKKNGGLMIKINEPEDFAKWLADGPKRRPKAYQVLMGGNRGLETNVMRLDGAVESFRKPNHPPPPPKESSELSLPNGSKVVMGREEESGFKSHHMPDFKSAASGENYEEAEEVWDAQEIEDI